MKEIVERMFERCIQDHEYEQALGIALECRRLDIVKTVLDTAGDPSLLSYVLDAVLTTVQKLEFRNEVRCRCKQLMVV